MFRPSKPNIFIFNLSSIIEHFELVSNLLNLLFISMQLKNVHRPLQVSSGICHFHRYVYRTKEFECSCSLKGVLPEYLFLQLSNLKQLINRLFEALAFEQKGRNFSSGLNHPLILGRIELLIESLNLLNANERILNTSNFLMI